MKLGGLQKCSLIDYPGKVSCIIFTQGCNFKCPWCHNGSLLLDKKNELISTDEIFSFLQTRIGLLDAVTITGGEPTIQQNIIPFLKRLRKLPFLIKLDTNGYNPSVLREVIAHRLVDYIAMDIKAPFEKYQLLTNTVLDIKLIKESIDLIKKSNIDYEFRTTYVAGMLDETDLIKISDEMKNARKWIVQEFKPEKSMDKVSIFKHYPVNFSWFKARKNIANSTRNLLFR